MAIVSGRRWALMHELAARPSRRSTPSWRACRRADLVLVEGYKREPHPKIEVRRLGAREVTPLAPGDPAIVAIAADHAVEADLPVFRLDDVAAIADFIAAKCGLPGRRT